MQRRPGFRRDDWWIISGLCAAIAGVWLCIAAVYSESPWYSTLRIIQWAPLTIMLPLLAPALHRRRVSSKSDAFGLASGVGVVFGLGFTLFATC